MGHGSHWAAVLNDFDKDLSAGLTLATEAGQLLGQQEFKKWDGPFGVDEARIALLQGKHGSMAAVSIVVSTAGKIYLHSAFPVVHSRSTPHRGRVIEIYERSFGLEACIAAEVGNAKIVFFDPYYALSKEHYNVGSEVDVRFAGLAYTITVPTSGQTVHHPEIGDVSLDGAAILLPLASREAAGGETKGFGLAYITEHNSEADLDDYQFRAPVQAISSETFLGVDIARVVATVMRPDDETAFDLEIAFVPRSPESQRFVAGADISGVLWLLGTAFPQYS